MSILTEGDFPKQLVRVGAFSSLLLLATACSGPFSKDATPTPSATATAVPTPIPTRAPLAQFRQRMSDDFEEMMKRADYINWGKSRIALNQIITEIDYPAAIHGHVMSLTGLKFRDLPGTDASPELFFQWPGNMDPVSWNKLICISAKPLVLDLNRQPYEISSAIWSQASELWVPNYAQDDNHGYLDTTKAYFLAMKVPDEGALIVQDGDYDVKPARVLEWNPNLSYQLSSDPQPTRSS